MKITVKDDAYDPYCSFHYKHGRIQYCITFCYMYGMPVLYRCTGDIEIYYFETHSLYEETIQYMLDNYSADKYELITDPKEINCYGDIWEPIYNYRKLTAEEKEKSKSEMLNILISLDDPELIRSLDYFKDKIMLYMPMIGIRSCSKCNTLMDFDKLYVDIGDEYSDWNVEYIFICEECKNKQEDQSRYSNSINSREKIVKIIHDYYHQL